MCAGLEQGGISCWIGPRDTQAGAYGRSIMEAIKAARMLVLVLSSHAPGHRFTRSDPVVRKDDIKPAPAPIERSGGSPDVGNCRVGDCWGSVAFGSGGAHALNHPTRDAAHAAALARCGGRCNVLTFHNSCGAYASGSGGHGWGNAGDRDRAQALALEQCRLRAERCVVRVWGCTSRK